jgi:glycolate oxidase FAD binding subunit
MPRILDSLATIAKVIPWDRSSSFTQDFEAQDFEGPNFALHPPIAVVEPESVAQLSSVVARCQADRIAMMPVGSGSKLAWGGPVKTDLPLVLISMARLNQLIDHADGDLTVTAQAGMKFADLQAIVQRSGQFCAIDPSYETCATIGGLVATGDSGALRHRYNSVRDMVLGIEFVRSDGSLVKAGGRVVKNVAGYDLMKLLTGSYGTLGILTQITLRLYPNQEASQTLFLSGDSNQLKTAIQSILNSGLTPTALDLISAGAIGALGLGSGQNLGLLIQIQGLAESVQEQCDRIVQLGNTLQLSPSIQTADRELWRQLGTQMTQGFGPASSLCKLAVRSTETIAMLLKIQDYFPGAIARFHVHGGLGQLRFDLDTNEDVLTQLKQVRSDCESKGGFLTLLNASSEIKQNLEPWGFRGNGGTWMRSIQQQFDPFNLLNPGRLEVL